MEPPSITWSLRNRPMYPSLFVVFVICFRTGSGRRGLVPCAIPIRLGLMMPCTLPIRPYDGEHPSHRLLECAPSSPALLGARTAEQRGDRDGQGHGVPQGGARGGGHTGISDGGVLGRGPQVRRGGVHVVVVTPEALMEVYTGEDRK